MHDDVIATYSHTDSEVRFLLRYTFSTGFFSGIMIGLIVFKIFF